MNINIQSTFSDIKSIIDKLTDNITTVQKTNISSAINNAKQEVGKWMKVDDAVVVFSDLKNSTGISFDKNKKTMAKLLELLNQPFIKIHEEFGAEFMDIKGDGGIAIYSSSNYLNAILAAITIQTYYKRNTIDYVKSNYDFSFVVTTGIANGDLLVKKVGIRGGDTFYVWAGETVNHSALISKELKKKDINMIGITQSLYQKLERLQNKDYILKNCGCNGEEKKLLWTKESLKGQSGEHYHYLWNTWCERCGQSFLDVLFKEA